MNCKECKERVFELIERQAVDPEAVRAILEKCPDCRALFEEMKAALEVARQLPIEEPPAEADAAILRAAAGQRSRTRREPSHWLHASSWAVAAVALLAIGIGVWAVPPRPTPEEPPAGLVRAELKPASKEVAAREDAPLEALGEDNAQAVVAEPDHIPARQAKAVRRAKTVALRPKAEAAVDARPGPERAAEARDEMAPTVASAAPAAKASSEGSSGLSPACRALISRIDEGGAGVAERRDNPEETLAIGRCYQAAGRAPDARKWLERAAAHPATKKRAERALRELSTD